MQVYHCCPQCGIIAHREIRPMRNRLLEAIAVGIISQDEVSRMTKEGKIVCEFCGHYVFVNIVEVVDLLARRCNEWTEED